MRPGKRDGAAHIKRQSHAALFHSWQFFCLLVLPSCMWRITDSSLTVPASIWRLGRMALAEGNVNLARLWLPVPPRSRSRKAVIHRVLNKSARELGREKELKLSWSEQSQTNTHHLPALPPHQIWISSSEVWKHFPVIHLSNSEKNSHGNNQLKQPWFWPLKTTRPNSASPSSVFC